LIGVNVPASKFSGAGVSLFYAGYNAGSGYWFQGEYGNTLLIGAQDDTYETWRPILNPADAWNIDTKLDDGKPGKGKILPHGWNECTDAADETDIDSDYLLTETGVYCSLFFRNVM
jgi:hypothetical protein